MGHRLRGVEKKKWKGTPAKGSVEMVHGLRPLGLVGLAVVALGVLPGCVPYKTYRDTKNKLAQAVDANADLVKRYNEAIQKLNGRSPIVMENGSQAELAALRAEKEQLQKRLDSMEFTPEELNRLSERGVGLERGGLQLGEALLFAPGEHKLKPGAARALDAVARVIQSNYPDDTLIIEGHTDDQPLRKSAPRYQYNMNLGYQRAAAVFKYFNDHGIPEKRMIIHAYSFNKTINPAIRGTKEGQRQNRRVVVRRGGFSI